MTHFISGGDILNHVVGVHTSFFLKFFLVKHRNTRIFKLSDYQQPLQPFENPWIFNLVFSVECDQGLVKSTDIHLKHLNEIVGVCSNWFLSPLDSIWLCYYCVLPFIYLFFFGEVNEISASICNRNNVNAFKLMLANDKPTQLKCLLLFSTNLKICFVEFLLPNTYCNVFKSCTQEIHHLKKNKKLIKTNKPSLKSNLNWMNLKINSKWHKNY